jgi:2-aminoethylphosphonate-pyruvate transaminase
LILLNPGPVTVSERVRRALAGPDLCHREPEFSELQQAVRTGLLDVYGCSAERWVAALVAGSGTAALEAMITSLVPADGRLLVLANGVYGERMAEVARIHRIACSVVGAEWGAPIDLAAAERALAAEPGIGHVAVVHHETTTGRLNDLTRLGALCRARGAGLLVDAVSSFGAERLELDAWGVAAACATSNKCLHGVPGVAFVIARRSALAAAGAPSRTLYLDLARHVREQDAGSTAFTPAVPAFHALREALAELAEEGGWAARGARYGKLAERVRGGLAELGIEPHLPPGVSSVVLRSYGLPEGTTYEALHAGLKARGFVIYAGQQCLRQQLFRISTMGEIGEADVERLLAAFREIR